LSDNKTVGIYIDCPNIDKSLDYKAETEGKSDFHGTEILKNLAPLLEYSLSPKGKITKKYVFIDKGYRWNFRETEEELRTHEFEFVRSPSTDNKSLTDSYLMCQIMDDIHEGDTPDIIVIVSGDKDFMRVIEFVCKHGKECIVIAEGGALAEAIVELTDRDDLNVSVKVFRSLYFLYKNNRDPWRH